MKPIVKLIPLATAAVVLAACDGNDDRNNLPNLMRDDPSITLISDISIEANESTQAVTFIVDDQQTDPADLMVSATSDNAAVIDNSGLQISSDGRNRALTITPIDEQLGSATITLTVTDADGDTVSTTFTATVIQQMLTVGDFAVQLFNDGPNDMPRGFESRLFIDGGENVDLYPVVVQ